MNTKIALIYSKKTGRLRSAVVPEFDWELRRLKPGPGEAMITAPNQPINVHILQAVIDKKTGRSPSGDRYAVVDQGDALSDVTGVVIADPDGCGDKLPGKRLIAHHQAGPGWRYHHGEKQFVAPL